MIMDQKFRLLKVQVHRLEVLQTIQLYPMELIHMELLLWEMNLNSKQLQLLVEQWVMVIVQTQQDV